MPIVERVTDVAGLMPSARYAHAVTVTGRLAFVAGQVAMDAEGNLVGKGDLAAQTEQCLANLHRIITSLGGDWSDVVRLNWYVVDAGQVQVIRDVRARVMAGAPNPASTLIQVAALFQPEFLVEVDAVVALP
ncbi:RidA family protein [Allorhizocola rhizosphaerae]|uniref:RidA family protein n=1 Tax=Allorhizocola rhizosphaerae TaxID=1872709 RepID=UPI000E3EBE31|nr:RidA family protein [Allorhizocola rhizosphaerae]